MQPSRGSLLGIDRGLRLEVEAGQLLHSREVRELQRHLNAAMVFARDLALAQTWRASPASTGSSAPPRRAGCRADAVTVAGGKVRIRHGAREIAVHKVVDGRRQRVVDHAHRDGVAGCSGPVRRQAIEALPVVPPSPARCGRSPSTKPLSEGASDAARKEDDRRPDRRNAGAITALRNPRSTFGRALGAITTPDFTLNVRSSTSGARGP
jgi:hypothetical protein